MQLSEFIEAAERALRLLLDSQLNLRVPMSRGEILALFSMAMAQLAREEIKQAERKAAATMEKPSDQHLKAAEEIVEYIRQNKPTDATYWWRWQPEKVAAILARHFPERDAEMAVTMQSA